MNINEFQEKYPTKEEKEEALKIMSDEEKMKIIGTIHNVTGKICYGRFIKDKSIINSRYSKEIKQ